MMLFHFWLCIMIFWWCRHNDVWLLNMSGDTFLTYICVCSVTPLCPTLCDPMDWLQPARLLCPWDFPGKNTGVGCHFLLQGISVNVLAGQKPKQDSPFLLPSPICCHLYIDPFNFLSFFCVWCESFLSLYWICYNTASISCFGFLAVRRAGSYLPDQGSNLQPRHWKLKS